MSAGDAARIPEAADALVAFLNSRPHATPTLPDTLDDPENARRVLGAFDPSGAELLPAERLEPVRRLRDDLVAVVEATAAGADVPGAWRRFTDGVDSVTLRQEFSVGGVGLRQVSGDPLLGGITAAVAKLVRNGTWSRVRMCANEDCRHVFYDTTRSRTQRWHSYEVCGNRVNVARHRARKTSTEPTS